ncbi:MAG: membrane protein insertion efficiency factor YidD [Desulfobacteraceae bacterium]|nr:membrane protein insertion efficiency factor YidD [Desulfobacteraceae bacterium]
MSPRNRKWLFPVLVLLGTAFPGTGPAEETAHPLIQFYQDHISAVDGDRCPMYPSCSAYAAEAVKKHGPVIGWIMACDRIVRCGRDIKKMAPVVTVHGENLYHDPVEANDFWWFEKPETKQE